MTVQRVSLYRGSFVHNVSSDKLEYIPKGTIGVDTSGKIIFIEKTDVSADDVVKKHGLGGQEVDVDAREEDGLSFYFPGFFDTHIHASQYPNSSIFGGTLLSWLNDYTFPVESSFSDIKKARQVYSKVVARTLANGTTTASYFATIHVDSTKVLADEALRYKQRAFVGRVCMLQNSPDYYCNESEEQAQQADLAIVDYINKIDPQNEIVAPIITPRFAPSCTESHMCWQGKLAKDHNLMCQTHISENVSEVEWVKELYPKCKSYANVYDSTGLLTDRMILAHAVHLTEEEKNLIKDRDSGISHCPISNSALTSGQAPVRSFLDKNIKVGLGTDVAGGYSPSILEVARHASLVSRHVCMQTKKDRDILSLDEVFYLATLGGAKVCNLDKKLGNFEVGKQFDAQFVNLTVKDSPIDVFEWNMPKSMDEKLNHSLQRWLYQGDDRNTRQVWVGGGLVVNKD